MAMIQTIFGVRDVFSAGDASSSINNCRSLIACSLFFGSFSKHARKSRRTFHGTSSNPADPSRWTPSYRSYLRPGTAACRSLVRRARRRTPQYRRAPVCVAAKDNVRDSLDFADDVSPILARPKSRTFTVPSGLILIFSGLRSRCRYSPVVRGTRFPKSPVTLKISSVRGARVSRSPFVGFEVREFPELLFPRLHLVRLGCRRLSA